MRQVKQFQKLGKTQRMLVPLLSAFLVSSNMFAGVANPAHPQVSRPPLLSAVMTPPPAPAPAPAPATTPAAVMPDQRRAIFFNLIQQTFKEADIRQDNLLMIGTGSWLNDQKKANSRDIDATIAYIGDNDKMDQGWKFEQTFNRLLGEAEKMYGPLNITLFTDIRSGIENEPDYYHGDVGQYFLYHHSDDSNKKATFLLSPDGNNTQVPTPQFWNNRGQDVPNSIAGAYVFVDDNMNFLAAHLGKTDDPVEKGKLIGKYVSRVEVDLKNAIRLKWNQDLPSSDPNITGAASCIGQIGGSGGDFEVLDSVSPQEVEAGLRRCLGISSTDDLGAAINTFLQGANSYFTTTSTQVQYAEPISVLPSGTPEPIPTNTSASPEPTPTNTSANPEPTPTNTSGEPTPTNTSGEPAPTNTSG